MSSRFAAYEHRIEVKDSRIFTRYFVVLKDEETIIGWTDFHKYIQTGKNKKTVKLDTNIRNRTYSVVGLLNYCFFDKYHVTKLTDITTEMVIDYLQSYALCKLPNDDEYISRKQSVVNNTIIHANGDFFCQMLKKYWQFDGIDAKDCPIEIPTSETTSEWVPVSKELPDDKQIVKFKDDNKCYIGYKEDGIWYAYKLFEMHMTYVGKNVKCWASLSDNVGNVYVHVN